MRNELCCPTCPSGKQNDRPQLEAALLRCRQSRATLLIAKLDRLSRNGAFLYNLRDSGQKFIALDIPDANALTLGVMIAMAQHEREVISARTTAALAARKARGLPLGTPRDLSAYAAAASVLGHEAFTAKSKARAADVMPLIEQARAAGCATLRQVAEWLEAEGIETPRRGRWTAAAVRTAELLAAGKGTRAPQTPAAIAARRAARAERTQQAAA